MNDALDGTNALQDPPPDNLSRSGFRKLLYILRLWLRLLMKAILICLPVMMLMWIYCTPALVMKHHIPLRLKEILYMKVRKVLVSYTMYSFHAIYGVAIAGVYYCQKALVCWVIGLLGDMALDIFLGYDRVAVFLNIFVIMLSIMFVFKEQLAQHPTLKLEEEFKRKVAVTGPIVKMAFVFYADFIIIRNLLPIFISSSFHGKLALRFFALPILVFLCSALQMHFIKSVPDKFTHYLTPMLWISNGALKIFERLFTNSLFNSGDYLNYMVFTFLAAIVEIIAHVTYLQRVALFRRFLNSFQRRVQKYRRGSRRISTFPTQDEAQEIAHPQMHDDAWIFALRSQTIQEDITIEIVMVFTVTLLLYFAHPLDEDNRFETIPSFDICIIQLFIQIAFELLSDVFGLYWSTTYHNITIRISDVELNSRWFSLWVTFMIFQSLYLFQYFFEV